MTGGRANFGIALPILLFFLLGGVVFWVTIPDIYIGQIWVGVSLLLALVFGGLWQMQRAAQRVLARGVRGTAQILGMRQTGVQVNDQPQVELHLRVEAPGIRSYELKKKFIVPLIALGQLNEGRVSVAVDPEDHDNVVVDWGAGVTAARAAPPVTDRPAPSTPAEPARASPAERLEQLRQLKEKGLVSEAEYESKRNQIIAEF